MTVPPGPLLSDALISSPILQGEDGAAPGMEYASEYGFDPNSDPELALVSECSSHVISVVDKQEIPLANEKQLFEGMGHGYPGI